MTEPGVDPRLRKAAVRVGLSFLAAIAAGVGVAVVYWKGGQPQLEGALLSVMLGGLGAGAVIWAHHLMPNEPVVEEREVLASSVDDREAVVAELGPETIRRRRILRSLLAGAGGATLAAFFFPIRSLGPRPAGALFETPWRPGSRAIDTDGQLVRADDVQEGGVLTVFPEGHPRSADGQAVLIRVEPGLLGGEVAELAAGELVAYSKLCTHLGCPVGLYQASSHLLLCPCHQSTFEVLDGGRPAFGPAVRNLPQLPIEVDGNGYVIARRDFTDAVGPGFWYRPE